MKKILLFLFVSFFFVSFSFAGGDDRDQVLPLNSLNEVTDESPKFLQEDELVEAQIDENIEEVIEVEPSKKEPVLSTQTIDTNETMNKTVASIKKYFRSDQGILVLLILFFVSIILLFNFFVREKNS
jgi:predicted PurR-regulated permease PerM